MDHDAYFMQRVNRAVEELPTREAALIRRIPAPRTPHPVGCGAWRSVWLAAWVLCAFGLGWFGLSRGLSLTGPQPLKAETVAPSIPASSIPGSSISGSELKTERIADLKVGLRVLAQTPETRGEIPPPLEISDPAGWRLFTLEQQKADGGTLRIELLRPAVGIASAVLTEADLSPGTTGLPLVGELCGYLQPAIRIPARAMALGADLGWKLSHTPNLDKLLIGKTLDLNLPEMGAEGEAKIVGISRCPEIEKGQGRVITGRFIHRAANVVDLLISGEEEPIGTTDNHPFWSEDRREYVPAGELRVGENLRTVNGSRTYVQSIRPRGPPEDVYNLEVEGAHTYHVGTTGVLVHNSCLDDMHHTIPKEIQRKLPDAIRTDPRIIGTKGMPNRIPVDRKIHREVLHNKKGISVKETGIRGGAYSLKFHQEILKAGGYRNISADMVLEIRDRLVKIFGI